MGSNEVIEVYEDTNKLISRNERFEAFMGVIPVFKGAKKGFNQIVGETIP